MLILIFLRFFLSLLLEGKETELSSPFATIITEQSATKIFGGASPLNKDILINGKLYKVVGIMKDFPQDSHFRYNFLISVATVDIGTNLFWEGGSFFTYIKAGKNSDITIMQVNINHYVQELYTIYDREKENEQRTIHSALQPLKKIHLHSHFPRELDVNGNINYVKVFIFLAFFSILISTINFVNIFTAFSEKRIKLIVLNKVAGASNAKVGLQIFSEIFFMIFVSLVVAIMFIAITGHHYLNILLDSGISKEQVFSFELLILFISIALLITLLSGIYPAFYLAKVSPAIGFSGINSSGISRKSLIYKTLICFQLIISIFLIINLSEIKNQIVYLKSKDLGFNKEHVLVFTNIPDQAQSNLNIVQDELRGLSFLNNITLAGELPGGSMPKSEFRGKDADNGYIECNFLRIDSRYLSTFEMKLVYGRNLDETRENDKNCVIINESAARALGFQSPVDKKIILEEQEFSIIGVVKDFNLQSLHYPVTPIVFKLGASRNRDIIINTGPDFSQAKLEVIEATIAKNLSFYMPNYYFMKDRFDGMYKSEEHVQNIMVGITYIGIIISFMGIWAFSSLFIRKRLREIGLRKIFGANNISLINLLFRDFAPWVLLSFIISFPLAYYSITKFLNYFAYKVGFSIYSLFIAVVSVSFIIVLSMGFHYFQITKANPADILKYD